MAHSTRFCEKCRQEIPAERCELIPETRLCVACSQVGGGEFDLIVTPEMLNKEGSMKKNYGGVTVRKVRKGK